MTLFSVLYALNKINMMNKGIIFITLSFLPFLSLGQDTEKEQLSDSVSIKLLDYSPKQLGDETAENAKNWTTEEKKWFKKTFIYQKGQFTVPTEPIAYPK
jgi:hypothetical protein